VYVYIYMCVYTFALVYKNTQNAHLALLN
jgi:hypothetical protein